MALLRENVSFQNMHQELPHLPDQYPQTTKRATAYVPLQAAPCAEVNADWTPPEWKVPTCCHRRIPTLCYCRHPGLHLNNISHTPPGQDICRIWRASFAQTDNGPPFNSHEFKTYASITGFRYRRITPLWPQTNAETERFMRTVKKVHQNCPKQRSKLEAGIIQIPAGLPDNTTLHYWRTPSSVLFDRTIKNRLPHLITSIAEDSSIRERDTDVKRTIEQYADRKAYVKPNDLRLGDTVIVKSDHTPKALTPYQLNPMTIK